MYLVDLCDCLNLARDSGTYLLLLVLETLLEFLLLLFQLLHLFGHNEVGIQLLQVLQRVDVLVELLT